jgi:ribonuclease HI/DNA polymerase-3 subunit epsilon
MWTLYTDGSCSPNPGPGGWGAVLIDEEGRISDLIGASKMSTNNRMELTAVIESLKVLPKDIDLKIISDSNYVVKGMTEWLPSWIAKDFKKVMNSDLWRELVDLCSERNIEWTWVKAHNGNKHNEEADQLANFARTKQNL